MSGRFSKTLSATRVVTNNHPAAAAAKATLRRHVLTAIGAERAAVFDGFAGDGAMWRAVWHEAASYAGCDLEWYRDEREAFVCDNRRVMRALDLSAFNIFDFDAWGSPWEQALILAARRPIAAGERVGLVLTEGSGLKLKMGDYPGALRVLAGIRTRAAGGSRSQDELLDRCLSGLSRRTNTRILRRWQARGRSGAAVIYVGLVLEGIA